MTPKPQRMYTSVVDGELMDIGPSKTMVGTVMNPRPLTAPRIPVMVTPAVPPKSKGAKKPHLSNPDLREAILSPWMDRTQKTHALDTLLARTASTARADGINYAMSPSAPRHGW